MTLFLEHKMKCIYCSTILSFFGLPKHYIKENNEIKAICEDCYLKSEMLALQDK